MLAIAGLVNAALLFSRAGFLEDLREIFPPARTQGDKDASRFLETIERLIDGCRTQSEDVWNAAMELSLTILRVNHSSAYATAAELPAILCSLPVDVWAEYLTDFRDLVSSIGIGAIGFCLGTLPDQYQRHGPERTGGFVKAVVEVATSYGATAGQWFLERKTQAAKRMLAC